MLMLHTPISMENYLLILVEKISKNVEDVSVDICIKDECCAISWMLCYKLNVVL